MMGARALGSAIMRCLAAGTIPREAPSRGWGTELPRPRFLVGAAGGVAALVSISEGNRSCGTTLGRCVMARPKKARPALPPIWRVPAALWAVVAPLLAEYDPPAATGRPRIAQREALDAIIYRLRTGVQWNHLPASLPDDSSVHRTFQRWLDRGVFDRVWAVIQEACEELGGVDWEWQAADTMTNKARKGGTAWARTRPIAPSPA